MLAHLDADPAPAHLVRNRGGGAAAEEAVEDEVIGSGGKVEYPTQKPFRLWSSEDFDVIDELAFFSSFVVVARFRVQPDGWTGRTLDRQSL
jgi:hypothetical protein